MATNRSHVFAAIEALRAKVVAAIEAIEDKEVQSDTDDDRINAYYEFLDTLDTATDDLESALEGSH